MICHDGNSVSVTDSEATEAASAELPVATARSTQWLVPGVKVTMSVTANPIPAAAPAAGPSVWLLAPPNLLLDTPTPLPGGVPVPTWPERVIAAVPVAVCAVPVTVISTLPLPARQA